MEKEDKALDKIKEDIAYSQFISIHCALKDPCLRESQVRRVLNTKLRNFKLTQADEDSRFTYLLLGHVRSNYHISSQCTSSNHVLQITLLSNSSSNLQSTLHIKQRSRQSFSFPSNTSKMSSDVKFQAIDYYHSDTKHVMRIAIQHILEV